MYYIELIKKGVKYPYKIPSYLYDSIKYKYIRYIKFRGRPFHEFYSYIMKERIKKLGPIKAIGGNWDKVGKLQYDFLIGEGLKSSHLFLDLGCGALRLGIKLIPYLDTGNYWGADISKDILDFGKSLIEDLNLEYKKPNLIWLRDNSFDEFKELNLKFDFITAHSVFTHMPLDSMENIIRNIKKIMHDDSRFYATYFESKDRFMSNREQDFYYPKEVIKNIADKYGYNIEFVERFKYSQQMFMLKLKR